MMNYGRLYIKICNTLQVDYEREMQKLKVEKEAESAKLKELEMDKVCWCLFKCHHV